jgi:hypothetical protein
VVDTDIIKSPGMLDFMAGGEGLGTVEVLEEGTRAADVTGLELVVDAGHSILPGLNTVAMAAAAQHEPSLA